MEIDDRTRERLDRQRHEKCRTLAAEIEQHVATLNQMLAAAAELELSVQVVGQQAKSGTRAFLYSLSVSCAEILP